MKIERQVEKASHQNNTEFEDDLYPYYEHYSFQIVELVL